MQTLTVRVFTAILCCLPVIAQTTQGLISGRIADLRTGLPITGAEVAYSSATTNVSGAAATDQSGNYYLAQLSPGTYRIRITAPKYQAQEIQELELDVAGRIEVNFRLRPLTDVWEAGQYRSVFLPGSKAVVTFYGPDVDSSRSALVDNNRVVKGALEATISEVVDPIQINNLPLAGRDAYTMLVLQPGVTADTTTARSLGLSSNGQRPSASNFLLDGLENNNYLVTGPLNPIPPEGIQEYRVSTNNYSAEYGRTSGYIANAVTRSGTNEWHGLVYADVKNSALNANDFQSNRLGQPILPVREIEPGLRIGGPIRRDAWFVSASFDYLRSRNRTTARTYLLPTPNLIAAAAPDSIARKLLTQYAPPLVTGPGLTATYVAAPPVSVDRPSGLARVDHLFARDSQRFMARFASTDTSRPDFQWTPYKDFVSGLTERTYSLALSLESSLRPGLTNELRFGTTIDDLNLQHPHPEVPILSAGSVSLPGSPIFSRFTNRIQTEEVLDNVTWARARHVITAGGGVLIRGISGTLTAGEDGQYGFATISDFANDKPNVFRIPLDRQALPTFTLPVFGREYRSNQLFFFVQDTFKVTPHFVVNYGVRYESYGAPQNVGAVKDALVQLGSGSDLPTRLATARLVRPGSGDESLFGADRNDWSARLGLSYNPSISPGTVIRAAFGTFYDRLFDNIWQNVRNNSFVLPTAFPITSAHTDFLAPVASVIPSYQGQPVTAAFPDPLTQSARAPTTMFQPGLRTPYVQSYFFGVQQQFSSSWSAEADYLGSVGRKLITTDSVNRTGTTQIGPILYRGNQGTSSYNALSTVARYRAGWADFQASYTWGHTIDNQSEVLRGDYFNLSPTRLTVPTGGSGLSAFTRQFDSSIDRASSDFDERHNLVFFSVLDLPRLRSSSFADYVLRDWKFSQLAAFRSGTPFTVYATAAANSGILNQRANLVNPALLYAGEGTPAAGGVRLLNAAAFATPAAGTVGNTGRNEFRSPGFYNFDISLSRSVPVRWIGEAGRLTFRADVFNFLNHANLNTPTSTITSSLFGIARYGRAGADSALPVVSPVNDTSRQIQLIVRLQF